MKIELTESDLSQIEYLEKIDSIIKFLKNRENNKFSIGDILVKRIKMSNDSWSTEAVSSNNNMARRYVYFYENQYGVGFLKILKIVDGTLGSTIYPMTHFNQDTTKFELDPVYADAILLDDGNFDIKALRKLEMKSKKALINANKGAVFVPTTISELNDFFSTLKNGDILYIDMYKDYLCKNLEEIKLDNLKKIMFSRLPKDEKEEIALLQQHTPKVINTNSTWRFQDLNSFFGSATRYSHELLGEHIYRYPPRQYGSDGLE